MGPRKRDNEVVKNTIRKIQQKRAPNERIKTKNLSLLRIEIPSKNDTKNPRGRVVTTQSSVSRTQLTKENNDNEFQPTKLILRSKTALKNQANAEKVNSKVKPIVQSTETDVYTRKSLNTETPVAKMAVKRKQTARRDVNKSISETNKSQAVDMDDSVVEESNCAKLRKSKTRKGNSVTRQTSVTKDIKPPNDANKCLSFTQHRLTRSNSTLKTAPSSRPKRVINNTKGKNIIETTSSKSILDSPHTLSKDRSIHFNITFKGSKPAPVKSRQTSVSTECMSWTKDISATSTTTCFTVHTDDFVRFDEKLPIVKLSEFTNASNVIINDKTNDEISKSPSHNDNNVSLATIRSPHLSSFSESDTDVQISSERTNYNDKNPDSLTTLLNKLTVSLKNFDTEIMYWIGYNSKDNDPDMQTDNEKFYSVFKEEGEVILNCRNIKKIILGDDDLTTDDKINEKADKKDAEVLNVDLPKPTTDVKSNSKIAQKRSPTCIKKTGDEDRHDTTEPNLANDSDDDVCHDDDDALSLFAESITGFESSRNNNSIQTASNPNSLDLDEYVPQPFNQNSKKANDAVSYHPTKIIKDPSNSFPVLYKSGKITCQKQSADSTSVYKECKVNENGVYRKPVEDSINCQKLNDDTPRLPKLMSLNLTNPKAQLAPLLISSTYKAVYCHKSTVFAGVCFFNLAYKCLNFICNFKHAILDVEVVKTRLRYLNETAFIQEYMLMRASRSLRKQYGAVFVDDCIRRSLTTLLLEMAIDYIQKSNCKDDQELMVEIVEKILLYLNTTDLTAYADYLLYILHTNFALCDGLINIIAETQNFTRFKSIFVKLSNFFCEVERDIKYNVATSLLVRLAILPYEEPLAKALLNVIKRTSRDILNNAMISHLENQLSFENEELYYELQMLKSTIEPTARSNLTMQQFSDYDFDNVNMNMHTETNSRCSPDTTRLDCLNKPFNALSMKRRSAPDTPIVPSIYNQNLEGRNSSSREDFLSSSAASRQIGGFAQPWFQERPSFTYTMRHRVPNRMRPTIFPGKFQYKFNKT